MDKTATDKTRTAYPFATAAGGISEGEYAIYGERLARVEASVGHMATKEDIQKIKVWVLSSTLGGILGGILGGMGIATVLTLTLVKLFS